MMSKRKGLINEKKFYGNWKNFLNEGMENLDEAKGDFIIMVPSRYPRIVDEDNGVRNALSSAIHDWLYKNRQNIAKASGMIYGGEQGPLKFVFNDSGSELAQQNWPANNTSNFTQLVDVPLGKHLTDASVLQSIMRGGQDRGRPALLDAIRDAQQIFSKDFALVPHDEGRGMG